MTLDFVDDTRSSLPPETRTSDAKNHRGRSDGAVISFDHSTRSEADGIQWRGTLLAALFLYLSISLTL